MRNVCSAPITHPQNQNNSQLHVNATCSWSKCVTCCTVQVLFTNRNEKKKQKKTQPTFGRGRYEIRLHGWFSEGDFLHATDIILLLFFSWTDRAVFLKNLWHSSASIKRPRARNSTCGRLVNLCDPEAPSLSQVMCFFAPGGIEQMLAAVLQWQATLIAIIE